MFHQPQKICKKVYQLTTIPNKQHTSIRKQYIQSIQKSQRFTQRLQIILSKFQENNYDPHIVLKQLDAILQYQNLDELLYLVNNSIDIISLIPERLNQIANIMKGKMSQVESILLFGNLASTFEDFGDIARQIRLTQQTVEVIKTYRTNADIESLYFWALSQLLDNNKNQQIFYMNIIGQQVQYCFGRWKQSNTLLRLISILSRTITFPINFIEQLCQQFRQLTHEINRINCFSAVSNSIQKYLPQKINQIDNKQIKKIISFMIAGGQKIPTIVVKNFYSIMCQFVRIVDYQVCQYLCKEHVDFIINVQAIPEFYEILYIICRKSCSQVIAKTFFECQDENGNNIISIIIRNLDDPNRIIIHFCLKIAKCIIKLNEQMLIENILRQGLQEYLQNLFYSERNTQLANEIQQMMEDLKIIKSGI